MAHEAAVCPNCGQTKFEIEVVLNEGTRGYSPDPVEFLVAIDEYRAMLIGMGIIKEARVTCHACGYRLIDFGRVELEATNAA